MGTITVTLEATTANLEKLKKLFKEEPESAVQPTKTVTKAEVRAKALELTKAGKSGELKKVLASFGAEKLSEVKEQDYAACLEKLEEVE